ncbi:MAG: hypothetical protein NVS9B4_22100 [Candidatus Acidiferrum sp.]
MILCASASIRAANAQGPAFTPVENTSTHPTLNFTAPATVPSDAASGSLLLASNTLPSASLASPNAASGPFGFPSYLADPAPDPQPRFWYGGRDDYRWQLALGATWYRFQSSLFSASSVGLNTSLTYFTSDWFGLEGNVATGFAPDITPGNKVSFLNYGAGPKIAWRQRHWEPWAHVLLGGAHENPQTAAGGKTSLMIQTGGGVDYRVNPRLSLRLQGDYVRTRFFNQSQNNYQGTASVVLHL